MVVVVVVVVVVVMYAVCYGCIYIYLYILSMPYIFAYVSILMSGWLYCVDYFLFNLIDKTVRVSCLRIKVYSPFDEFSCPVILNLVDRKKLLLNVFINIILNSLMCLLKILCRFCINKMR
jgi:hypothetical protein